MIRSYFPSRCIRLALSVSLACGVSLQAYAQDASPGRGLAASAQTQAQVVGIDSASNSVALKGPSGRIVEVAVNPQVGDVSKLRIGDTINIEYRTAMLVRATKAPANAIRERVDTDAAIPASGGLSATAHTVEVIATIQHIDAKKRRVTLRGPQRTVTLDVSPDVSLAGLKAGDMVHAQFEEATAVQVLRDGQPVK
jgi:Cu/Ag efflux protein CusF